MTGQFPEVIFTVQTVHFSHSSFHLSPSPVQPFRALSGLQKEMVTVRWEEKEEHVGLPLLWISFPLDLPTFLEEEVIVGDKTKKGHLSYVVIIYLVLQRVPLLLHSVVTRVMEG